MEQDTQRKEKRGSRNDREKRKDGAGTTEKREKMELETQRKDKR
jgi:hypothetical protein